jgi:hypothetical protein
MAYVFRKRQNAGTDLPFLFTNKSLRRSSWVFQLERGLEQEGFAGTEPGLEEPKPPKCWTLGRGWYKIMDILLLRK